MNEEKKIIVILEWIESSFQCSYGLGILEDIHGFIWTRNEDFIHEPLT